MSTSQIERNVPKLTSYAVNFNRTGHLFQNRYKSIVCEKKTYLFELVRYIHLNPLRAGLVKDLRDRLPLAMTLAELIRRVAAAFDLPAEAVSRHGKARPTSEARGIVAYFAVRELGLKGIDVGKVIHLTSAGVSIAVQRGERLVREKPGLNEILAKLVT